MPSLQDIEKFKTQLNALGSEPEILAEQGEAIEDLPPPEQGPAPDLSDLFARAEAVPGEAEAEAPSQPGPGEEELDFSSLFGLEGGEEPETLEVPPVEKEPAAEAPTEEEVPVEAFGEGKEALEFAIHEEGAEEAPPEFPEPPGGEVEAPIEAEAPEAIEVPLEAEVPVEFPLPPGGRPSGPPVEAEAPGEFPLPPEEAPSGPPAAGPEAAGAFGEELVPPEEAFQLPEEFLAPPEAEEPPVAAAGRPAEAPPQPPPEAPSPEAIEEMFTFPAEGPFGAPEAEAGKPGEAEISLEPSAEAAPAAKPGAEGPGELPEEFAAPGLFEEQVAEAPVPPIAPVAGFEEAAPAAMQPGPELAPEGEPEREFALTERRFAMLKRTLATLPRNLKMLVEELIGVQGLSGPNLAALAGLLAEGAAPARIAEEVSRITGQRVRLPRGYERLTGLAFEEERVSFRYALRENIFPILRVALLSVLFLGLLSFLGYRYIYRPLYANALYRQGYVQIQRDRYPLAEDRFARANAIMRYKGWYLRYAGAYTAKRQYALASQKYELLLKHFPLDRQGTLAYAGLLTYSTFGWERAEQILNEYLEEKNFKDRAILLARGDNYLEWAEEDGKLYEQARLQYATILDHYGETDEVLFRMMRYFIRVKPPRFEETRKLYRLLEGKKELDVYDTLSASVYAELGGFWFDQAEQGNQAAYDDVKEVLFKAMRKEKFLPEVHYQLARYYRYLKDDREEEKALTNAITLLSNAQPQTKKRQIALIDSYTRLGEYYWRRKEYLEAEESLENAIKLIEQKQAQRILGPASQFGLAYLDRGDIYYYVIRDLRTARTLYENAERNGYRSTELDYRFGYLDYAEGNYEQALLRFARVLDERGTSENALFSLANSLYYQSFYSSAQGYYLRLLDLLELRQDRIPFLSPADNPEHRNLVEFLMKVYNNLGVTYRRLSERSRDPDQEAKALVNLTYSSEYFDQLTRDPNTAERGITRNLAYLNQRGILYPTRPFELQLYDRIPLDLEAAVF
jgi:tetratricopeptide (TPR) repeat protein